MFFGGRRLLLLDITVGLGGAIAGGWGTACALGERTSQAFLLTILVAVFGAAVMVWLAGSIYARFGGRGD